MDYHNGIVTHPEPDILEYEVKWALGSTAANEVSGGDGIPAELFKNPKNYAVKVLYSICQQSWETQQLPQDWKMSILIPVPKKGSVKTTGWLLLGRKAMTNLDSVLKSKDITLSTKVHIVKALVFPVAVYRCESWTIKNAKHWRINVFELWCWRRLLRVPWTARRSNQSFSKEISHEDSLEGLMLKLKLQYFGHLMWRTDSLEKTLMLEKSEGRGRRGWQRMRWLDDITQFNGCELGKTLRDGEGQGSLGCYSGWGLKELDTTW